MNTETRSVEIRSNMLSIMAIELRDTDLKKVAASLQHRVSQAPDFFKNTPVIVDFSCLTIDHSFDFNALFKLIRQQQLLPVAIKGVPSDLGVKMQQAGVPIVEQPGSSLGTKSGLRRGKSGKTFVVDAPVVDGQQCFAQDGDLVLLASHDAGAELIADGSIHVYGPLLGRAACGMHGDTDARIYCSALETDLVSVAGETLPPGGISDALKNRPVQIRLSEGKVVVEPLDRSAGAGA